MARGGHGLPKILLEPAMPDSFTPCGQPPLKRPYSHFRDGRPKACGRFQPRLDNPSCAPLLKCLRHETRASFLRIFFDRKNETKEQNYK
jgi:hypothetical protein